MKHDSDIRCEIERLIATEPCLHAYHLWVSVDQGSVSLRGRVDERCERDQAEDLVRRVIGVLDVSNDIVVLAPQERTDTQIHEAAWNALRWLLGKGCAEVRVDVVQGWVQLTGTVHYQRQRVMAERAVRGIGGVRGVSNCLNSKPYGQPVPLAPHMPSTARYS